MLIKYTIKCPNYQQQSRTIAINGKLVFWGTLMSFNHLRNYNQLPLNKLNVWIYAKQHINAVKFASSTRKQFAETTRLISFLVLNKEFNADMLMSVKLNNRQNEYIAFSSQPSNNDYYHFAVHITSPKKLASKYMSPVNGGNNFYYDIHYDSSISTLVLQDPDNHNKVTDYNFDAYKIAFYKRLLEDFERLPFEEKIIKINNLTFITKTIDCGIRIGVEESFLRDKVPKNKFDFQISDILCKSGLLIQFFDGNNQSEIIT